MWNVNYEFKSWDAFEPPLSLMHLLGLLLPELEITEFPVLNPKLSVQLCMLLLS